MNSAAFKHVAISASAGTGKTYALAHRYIALVQHGVPPDRICALTFSRKAAGEIFDEIIRHLCNGASSTEKARQSSDEIGHPCQPPEFAIALRQVVDHMHRLHIGTIDSFVVGVARAFPFELGISPDFRIGDSQGAAGDEIRRTLQSRLFDPGVTSEPVRQAFLEAFKLATFGQEHKSPGQALERFLTELTGIHRRIPQAQAWGQPHVIWNRAMPWLRLGADTRTSLAAIARDVAWPDAKANQQYQEMVAFLCEYDDQREWPVKMEKLTLFPRLWQVLTTPAGEPLAVSFNRKNLLLPPPATDALRQLVGHAMAVEIERTLQQTRGVQALLALYEILYAEHMRRSGQLGFDDLARLVAGSEGRPLSRFPGQPDRLFINYRLDAVLDHWLLDEFQDTSDLQWRVLGNLIDETVQDDSSTRSFFYVGDVKQAIYGWRGGNHRLFSQVKNHYGTAIEEIHRNVSFRSSPVVIDALNRIFGELSEDDHLPPKTLADWRAIWCKHDAARMDLPGCVELLEAADDDEQADDARYRTIAERLAIIEPVARNWKTAVLLRTNEKARRCADVLRAHLPDTPVALEGQASLLDNPLVPLLLSLVRFAAHPGDQFAWQHLQMSPLGRGTVGPSDGGTVGQSDGETVGPSDGSSFPPPHRLTVQPSNRQTVQPSHLSLEILTQIHGVGFQATLRDWCARLETVQPFDTFTRLRRDDLLDAAASFDATGDCDCDRFTRFIEGYTRHDTAAEQAISVMTIHQSKGLGFDLVCVPFDPNAESFDNPGRADMLEEENSAWVLKAPRQLITASDEVLRAAQENQRADAAFAKLCVFYVALTRAKQGLILVVAPPPKTSTVVREDTLLRARLADGQQATSNTQHPTSKTTHPTPLRPCPPARDNDLPPPPATLHPPPATLHPPPATLFSSGDRDWYLAHARCAASTAPATTGARVTLPSGAPRLKRVEPSQHDQSVRPAATLFARESGDVRIFGSAIHRLFQQIEWIETFDQAQAVQAWRASATEPDAVLHDAEQQFRASLTATEVQQSLRRPAGNVVLWREKPFELLHEGQLLAGQFDRVMIERDAADNVSQVTLWDFKSNRVETDAALHSTAEKYRNQMSLYAAALRRIFGPVPIATNLVFTRVGRVVRL